MLTKSVWPEDQRLPFQCFKNDLEGTATKLWRQCLSLTKIRSFSSRVSCMSNTWVKTIEKITWNNIYLGDEWKQSGNGWKITECMWLYCRHQVTLMYQRCQQHVSGQQNYLFTKARHTTIVRFPCPCYEHFLSIPNP